MKPSQGPSCQIVGLLQRYATIQQKLSQVQTTAWSTGSNANKDRITVFLAVYKY